MAEYWQMGLNGVFSITLKEGHQNPLTPLKESLPEVNSVQPPRYENPIAIPGDTPDLRSSLYRVPFLIIGPDGKNTLSFNCSDDIAGYTIEIFGISENGETGYYVDNLIIAKPSD